MTIAGSYGITIFCDDIRDEILGKKTFIGCYSDQLIAPEFPVLLPTFAMYVRFVEPIGEASEILNIRVTLEYGSEYPLTVLDAELPPDRRQQVSEDNQNLDADHLASVMYLRSSPFIIDRPGVLKVRAARGSEEFKLGSLRIVLGDVPMDALHNQAVAIGRLDNS